ncbi:MAG: molybdopterin-dependent oxidoreductase [SAR324 cluster bacterium]|nr:molybdopterin-dependent oxidoreductase [SAR324 cluster bacterium]
MAQVNRRKFLKISSAFLASSAAGLGWPLITKTSKAQGIAEPDRIVSTTCEICFWRCGVDAYVRDEKVYKLAGHKDHPLSNGKLCPRGNGGQGLLYDPNRLKHPLIRETVNGKEQFRKASWDEATSLIAERFGKITKQYGTESVVMFSHGFGASFFKTLFSAYGIHTFSAPSYAQCRGPRSEAFKLTFGHAIGSPEGLDIANSRYLVLLGSHLGENMHNTAVQDFSSAISKGCEVVVVDPRFSVAAGKAKHWLPIKPGTDLALLRGWIHILLKEKRYDIEFIEQNAVGLEELWQGVKYATPEQTYAITGIPVEQIVQVARDLGRYGSSALVHPGRHVTWYGDDTQRERAIAILNALIGNYRMPGGIIRQEKFTPIKATLNQEKFKPYKADFPVTQNASHTFQSRYPFASQVPANEIVDQTISGSPYPVKSWFVYGTNLIQSLGNQPATLKALQQLDFVVAVDVLPAEITGYADVILPECTYLERYDDLDNRTYRTPYVAIRQPVVEPLYESKPGHEIARLLSEKMGMPDLFKDDIETYLNKQLKQMDSSLDELKKVGVLKVSEKNLYRQPGEALQFKTPSGKIELASSRLREAGFDAVPQYQPPPENPPGYFRLLYGRAPMHTFGRTANNRVLGELMPENELWVNQVAGRDMKLKHGEYVYLVNQDGVKSTTKIKIRLTERIRPDAVYMVHGFGHTDARLEFAYQRGVNSSDMITQLSTDPIMGATGMNNNFVTFTRS